MAVWFQPLSRETMLLKAANCAGSLIICWAIALALVGAAWAGTVASMEPATPRATTVPARAFLEAAMRRMTELDTEIPSTGDKGGRGMPGACVSHSRGGEGFVGGG